MRSLRDLVTGLPRTFWLLWVGTLVNKVGGFVYPFLALYLTAARKMPVEEASQIVALYGAGSLAAALVGGRLADRIGRRTTLLVALFGGGAAMLSLGFAQRPGAIAFWTFALALVQDMWRPAVSAIIADVVPPQDRARAFGLQYWAINLGFSIAPAVAGVVASRGYLWLFAGDAATTFACGLLMLWKVPETHPARGPGHAASGGGGDLLAPFRDRVFVAFVGLTFLTSLLFFQAQMGMPIDMKAHGISEQTYGAVISINGVMIVLLQPFASRITGGRARSAVMAAGALLIGAGFGSFGLVATVGGYVAGVVVFTLGEILQAGLAPTIVSDLAPVRLRGTYQGMLSMAWGLASLVSPSVSGRVLGGPGARLLWGACLVIGLAASGGHLLIAGPRRRRLVELRAAALPVSAFED